MSKKQSPITSDYDRPTLKRSEVAKLLNLSTRQIPRLVKNNLLTEARLKSPTGGRSLPRYSKAAVDAYLGKGYAA